jgi:hypothetical protein
MRGSSLRSRLWLPPGARPTSVSPAFVAVAILVTLPRPPGAFMNVEKGHTGVMQTRIHGRRGAGAVHQQPLWSPAPQQRDYDRERRGQQDPQPPPLKIVSSSTNAELDQPLGAYAEQVVLDAADVAPAPAGCEVP